MIAVDSSLLLYGLEAIALAGRQRWDPGSVLISRFRRFPREWRNRLTAAARINAALDKILLDLRR